MCMVDSKKILIDGKNLSLVSGTGIATYSKSLCKLSRELGYSVDFICGKNLAHHKLDLLNEISFYDNATDLTMRQKLRAYAR